MLTPTDIHYLVGLLSMSSHQEDVDVELGDYVHDARSESKRDVDVTITVRNKDGTLSAFKGLEVKALSRKLGTHQVDGLIRKLQDMPSITHRAVVSASGFTLPAIRKATSHGVELYELKAWNPSEGFDFFQCKDVPAVHTEYGWSQPPHIHINPGDRHSAADIEMLRSNPPVWFQKAADRKPQDLNDWLHKVSILAAKEAEACSKVSIQQGIQRFPANVTVRFDDGPYVLAEGNARIDVKEVRFTGLVERRSKWLASTAKALFKVGEMRPLAGCCISDFGSLGLMGLLVTERRNLEWARIPVADRIKKKIFRQRLQTSRPPSE
jgi:hypothetical protein